jgi:predicted transcriptional regulator of viral defense system
LSTWARTLASKALSLLAESRRRVVSDWRLYVLIRRVAQAENIPLPDAKRAIAVRKELLNRGEIKSVDGINNVFVVETPYSNLLQISEEQIVQESNPWAVFGYLTALTHHGLSDLVAKDIYAIASTNEDHLHRLPLGTTPDDWADVDKAEKNAIKLGSNRLPKTIRHIQIVWSRPREERNFGIEIAYSFGVPIYMTDPERTLIDCLQTPTKAGGIAKVLEAWKRADGADINKIVSYAELYQNQVLRQRVGFILSRLGRTHPKLSTWQKNLKRGGSVKLLASAPYADEYSTEWNLSLNVPSTTLEIFDGNSK